MRSFIYVDGTYTRARSDLVSYLFVLILLLGFNCIFVMFALHSKIPPGWWLLSLWDMEMAPVNLLGNNHFRQIYIKWKEIANDIRHGCSSLDCGKYINTKHKMLSAKNSENNMDQER